MGLIERRVKKRIYGMCETLRSIDHEVIHTYFFFFFFFLYINKEKLLQITIQNKHYNTTRTIPRGASDYDYPGAFENTKLKTTAALSSDATKYLCETRKFFSKLYFIRLEIIELGNMLTRGAQNFHRQLRGI